MVPQLRKLAWVLAVGLLVAPVVAEAGDISSIIFRIDATNTVGSGYLQFTSDQLVYNASTNQWVWSTGFNEILDGTDVIATLDSATLKLVKDPALHKPYYIEFGFTLHSGTADTDFSITSALISFATLPPEKLQPPTGGGRATASFTATDVNGNGVTLTPNGPAGSGVYTAQYDGWVPDGITLASLVGEISIGPGGSGGTSQTYPSGSGYAAIGNSVYDMSAMAGFSLTYDDTVSATTTYRILPEPAGLGLLLLGAVALGWRRR
jgi:hypothetical protein